MSIAAITSGTSSVYSTADTANQIRQYQTQRAKLELQVQQENVSKDDAKTKAQKVALLQIQIAQIDTQIQQQQSAKSTQSANSGGPTTAQITAASQRKADANSLLSAKNAAKDAEQCTVSENNIDIMV